MTPDLSYYWEGKQRGKKEKKNGPTAANPSSGGTHIEHQEESLGIRALE